MGAENRARIRPPCHRINGVICAYRETRSPPLGKISRSPPIAPLSKPPQTPRRLSRNNRILKEAATPVLRVRRMPNTSAVKRQPLPSREKRKMSLLPLNKSGRTETWRMKDNAPSGRQRHRSPPHPNLTYRNSHSRTSLLLMDRKTPLEQHRNRKQVTKQTLRHRSRLLPLRMSRILPVSCYSKTRKKKKFPLQKPPRLRQQHRAQPREPGKPPYRNANGRKNTLYSTIPVWLPHSPIRSDSGHTNDVPAAQDAL